MTKKKKRFLIIISSALALLIAIVGFIIWGNKALMLNEITIESESLPKSFEGFRIAQVSDLHNAEFGKGNKKLIKMLKKANPDIIAITGDIIDSRNTNVEIALNFAEEAQKIAPCYFVSGNHEARVPEDYEILKAGFAEIGVTVLENEAVDLERLGEQIKLLGVDDPSFETDYLFGDDESFMKNKLESIMCDSDTYTVLLSHRPELFEVYAEYDVDVILSGHAHGGQFRLPFIGGLYAPNQGLMPMYDAGLYCDDNTNMIVSRGLGNSLFPFRLNNRPEVILVELMCAD